MNNKKNKLMMLFLIFIVTTTIVFAAYNLPANKESKDMKNIDKRINELFDNNVDQVKIAFKLKDMIESDDLLSKLSQDEFKIIRKSSSRIVGEISKEGFDKLINDERVVYIYGSRMGHMDLDVSIPLIEANTVWSSGYTGDGVKICVLDTGVAFDNPEFNGQIIDEYCYCSHQERSNTYCCPGDVEEGDSALDNNGHGTHVTGIIASQNSTFKGVAYDADIYVIKIANSTGVYDTIDVGDAIEKCISWGVDIISMSFSNHMSYPGSGSCPNDLVDEFNNATNHNIALIAASGNNGYNDGISHPACSPNVISVAAVYDENLGNQDWSKKDASCNDTTTAADNIACFSSRAANLDLLAPGCRINSTSVSAELGTPFEYRCGTSMATPHVTGVAALLLEKDSTLNPNEVRRIMKFSGKDIYDNFNSGNDGAGSGLTFPRVNASAAINGAYQSIAIDFFSPSSDTTISQGGSKFFIVNMTCTGTLDCGTANIYLDPKSTEYTPTSKTSCEEGVCTKSLYSGVRYVYEDNSWKGIEDAKSLMGKGFDVVYLEEDEKYPLEVVDFNYNSIKVKFNPINSEEEVPVRIWKYDEKLNEQFMKDVFEGKKEAKGLAEDYKEIYALVKEEKSGVFDREKVYEFSIGDILEFGPHSTTITLQDNESENMADLFYYSTSGGYKFGSQIRWNISSIPTNVNIIDEANLCLYVSTSGGTPDNDIVLWRLNDQGWNESYTAAQIASQSKNNETETTLSSISVGTFGCADVTDIVSVDYELENDYSSLRFEDPDQLVGSIVSKDNSNQDLVMGNLFGTKLYFHSRNYGTADQRPVLNITYSAIIKSGLVSTTTGAVPFYTTWPNPTSVVDLKAGETEGKAWRVYATGAVGSTHEFFAYANLTSNMSISDTTDTFEVTII